MDQLLKEIEVAKNIENKLILIIGSPGSGKSKLIHEYSDYCGIPILNLDNIFKDNSTDLVKVMDDFLQTYDKDILLLDNKRILYAKDSNIDMLAFLKALAKKVIVIATWNGRIEDNKLIHIRSNSPTDLTYSLTNEDIKFIQK
ncbi:BREX-3 system P-loop-containing protein BrxF [Thomasclavelia cocleata]|jgi:archaellum biogenesis ATPase FlaH|uniref:BREX-3 system P-loop-containing protein BrxF n=1 Tax=Thomasclavelia cocleata TaxID=69824 RepID=UPI00241F117D|nr:BREX-3 system P-loop-containing protein BrxF [Thomasclavelia cocleata]MCI9131390.1 BREX-3 system P-loop-containing protein BrxF [Thomasclavelia cocleata]MCI9630058.1 BREX-3 system P-loop-containing protein BrxF [Thomasclavelia cocleata]